MKKLVCYSLWGENPKYTIGALRNASSIATFFPGWIGRFYCGGSVPTEIVKELDHLGSEVVPMDEKGDWKGMFWRFLAISDPDVEVMLSRDTDSRLSECEAAAVAVWLRSDKNFHIMRDHPSHTAKIMGGMWGARRPLLANMKDLIGSFAKGDYWQVDQEFLEAVVWPLVQEDCVIHDSSSKKYPFPTKRRGLEFVGQVWDEHDVEAAEYTEMLRAAMKRNRFFGLGRLLP